MNMYKCMSKWYLYDLPHELVNYPTNPFYACFPEEIKSELQKAANTKL